MLLSDDALRMKTIPNGVIATIEKVLNTRMLRASSQRQDPVGKLNVTQPASKVGNYC